MCNHAELVNTNEPPSTVSEWTHPRLQSMPLRFFAGFPQNIQKAIYNKIIQFKHRDRRCFNIEQRHVCALCRVGWLPAGSHHMSPLLAPALPLPGPPWPPAHTPQAAETERQKTVTDATIHIHSHLNLKDKAGITLYFPHCQPISWKAPVCASHALSFYSSHRAKHPIFEKNKYPRWFNKHLPPFRIPKDSKDICMKKYSVYCTIKKDL